MEFSCSQAKSDMNRAGTTVGLRARTATRKNLVVASLPFEETIQATRQPFTDIGLFPLLCEFCQAYCVPSGL